MKTSSYVAYYVYKFAALMFLSLALAHSVVFPSHSLFDQPNEALTIGQILFTLGVAVLCVILAKFMFFRIRVIRYDNDTVEIVNGSETETVSWNDVASVSKVFSVAPPLYRMTFYDDREPAYFVISMFMYAYALFWSWDFTGFYEFAQEKIRESGNR